MQISSTKRYNWALIFVRSCLILHNLIIRLEEGDPDTKFAVGGGDGDGFGSNEGLQLAQIPTETAGQSFRKQVMARLFDSPSSGVVAAHK